MKRNFIRLCTLNDVEKMHALSKIVERDMVRLSSFADSISKEEISSCVSEKDSIALGSFLFGDPTEMLGYILCRKPSEEEYSLYRDIFNISNDEEFLVIRSLRVQPIWQGTGVGTELFDMAIARGRMTNRHHFFGEVQPSNLLFLHILDCYSVRFSDLYTKHTSQGDFPMIRFFI